MVHRVVLAASLESCFAGKAFLVIIANVRSGHVLMLDAGDALADFLALDVLDVTQHAFVTEIPLRQIVCAQRRCVVGRERDQMVEDTGLRRRIALEGANALVGF